VVDRLREAARSDHITSTEGMGGPIDLQLRKSQAMFFVVALISIGLFAFGLIVLANLHLPSRYY